MEILNYARSLQGVGRGFVISRAVALGFVMSQGFCPAAVAPEQQPTEYQVKAAFLCNFVKFVQWPSEVLRSPSEPYAICVLGQDPFGSSLVDSVAGRVVEGRSLVVRHIADVKQVRGCHIVFVSSAETKRWPPALEEIKTPGVLTVAELEESGADGVVINFRMDGGKVRFEINVEAAERARLSISSRLLSLARIVKSRSK